MKGSREIGTRRIANRATRAADKLISSGGGIPAWFVQIASIGF